MALLNFKYGKHGNLPEWSLSSVGTVFVTTDEQAMHIDLPDGRVVISQIINVASVSDWQNMKPPYSTQAFYYIVDANALLKYTGDGTTHSWKQINSTADVQAEVDKLREDLGSKDSEGNWTSGLGKEVAGHTTEITNIKSEIGNNGADGNAKTGLHGDIASLADSVQGVATHVTNVEALVHTLESVVGYAGAFSTEAEALADDTGAQAGEVCLVNGAIKLCSVDDAGKKYLTDYQTIIQEIEDLKDEVENVKDTVASNETIVDLQSRVKALEDWKVLLVAEIGTPTNGDTAATGMYALIESAQAQADSAKSTADQALADAKKANDAIGVPSSEGVDATGLYAKIEKNETDIATNAGDIKTNAEDIDELEKRADALENAVGVPAKDGAAATGLHLSVANAQQAADDAQADADKANAAIGNDGTDGQPKTGLNLAVSTNTTNITDEVARAKAAEKANADAIAALRTEVMEDIQTADAMVFKDVVASKAELIAKEATAQIGHTYKAADEFTLTQGDSVIAVHVGDLLIATGTENTETGIITDVVWKHVPSGYVADYNPKIEAAEDVEGDNEVVLALSSGVAKDQADLANRGDLGKITLATAEGSALTVSTDNAGKVTFSMVWESFDPVTE